MGRNKLQLKLIEDQKNRRMTYRKRKEGLKKKAYELSTLCDTPVMMICYDPNGTIDTWPENPQVVHDIIKLSINHSMIKGERCLDLQSYFTEQITKQESRLDQITRDCADMLFVQWQQQHEGMSSEDLARSLDSKIDAIKNRIKLLSDLSGSPCGDTGGQSPELYPVDDGNALYGYPYDSVFVEPCSSTNVQLHTQVTMDAALHCSFDCSNALYGCENADIGGLPSFPPDNSLGSFENLVMVGGGVEDHYYANIGSTSNNNWLRPFETLTSSPLIAPINWLHPADASTSSSSTGGPYISNGGLAPDNQILPFDASRSDSSSFGDAFYAS